MVAMGVSQRTGQGSTPLSQQTIKQTHRKFYSIAIRPGMSEEQTGHAIEAIRNLFAFLKTDYWGAAEIPLEDRLAAAACAGNLGILRFAIEEMGLPDFVIKIHSLLMCACSNDRLEVAEYLLDHGANPNAVNRPYPGYDDTEVVLHIVTRRGSPELAQLLIDRGAIVDAYTTYCGYAYTDKTPLHVAAKHGRIDMVELLLKNKADINASDSHGETAYHMAVSQEMKDLLLRRGATTKKQPERGPVYGG